LYPSQAATISPDYRNIAVHTLNAKRKEKLMLAILAQGQGGRYA
jgi:hypothetical protein